MDSRPHEQSATLCAAATFGPPSGRLLHKRAARFRILAAALSALAAAATAVPTLAQVSDAREFFPLQDGNRWTYLKNASTNITETVLPGTVSVNGVPTKRVQSSDGSMSYYTNDANGVRLHRQFEPDVLYEDGIARDTEITYTPALKFAANQTSVGDVFTGQGTATYVIAGLGTTSLDYELTSEIQPEEQVSVPLGTFVAVRDELTLRLFDPVDGEPIGEGIDTLWLARYLGPVKLRQAVVGEGIDDTLVLTDVWVDTDGDGVCDLDDDNDGVSDEQERLTGRNPLLNEAAALIPVLGIVTSD